MPFAVLARADKENLGRLGMWSILVELERCSLCKLHLCNLSCLQGVFVPFVVLARADNEHGFRL